jgi:endonuclease YncB( thermonuclease family)
MTSYRNQQVRECIVHHFCDGDTVVVLVHCPCCGAWQKRSVRLRGIDAAELRSPQRAQALSAATKLTEKFAGKVGELFLMQKSSDKYGRLVGDINIVGKQLSDTIVEMGLAYYTRIH